MEMESTLKPAEVAIVMVEFAIAKHRTRPEQIFVKAVSTVLLHIV